MDARRTRSYGHHRLDGCSFCGGEVCNVEELLQCVGHIIRRSRDMEAEQTREAVRFPRQVKGLLQGAIELGKARHLLPPSTYEEAVGEVRTELKALVSQDFSHSENLKPAKHIFKHQDNLLRFLEDPAVPPTNNLAEQ